MKVAAVILAAGESARLGRPKQLLAYRGRSLLRHVIGCADEGGCDPVIVVLGARQREMLREIEGTPAQPVINPNWSQGLHSSIRAGAESLPRVAPDARALLLLTCDQPRITPEVVRGLCERFDGAAGRMVACEYADTIGIPALFEQSLFAELAGLSGPGGAKSVLQAHPADVLRFPWPDGAVDIDRAEDIPPT